MYKAILSLLALAFAGASVHADSDVASASANKAGVLEQIGRAENSCDQRSAKVRSCCAGHVQDCPMDVRGNRALNAAKSRMQDGPGEAGASGAAVSMGDFTDELKEAGEGFERACAQAAASCRSSCSASLASLKTACTDCSPADFSSLNASVAKCDAAPSGLPPSQQAGPSKPRIPPDSSGGPGGVAEGGVAGGSLGGGAVATGGMGSGHYGGGAVDIGGDLKMGQPAAKGHPTVEVVNDNGDWRKSLKASNDMKLPVSEAQRETSNVKPDGSDGEGKRNRRDKFTSSADSLLSGFTTQSAAPARDPVAQVQDTPVAAAAIPNATPPPAAANLATGAAGFREGSQRVTAAAAQSAVIGARVNVNPAVARPTAASRGSNSFGRAQNYNGGTSGDGSFGLAAMAVESSNSPEEFRNTYKAQDTGVDDSGGGSGDSTRRPAKRAAPNLEDYLPNHRLSPASRGIAGAADDGRNPQILSQSKDVWQNMSARIQYFCKIGRLYDCK